MSGGFLGVAHASRVLASASSRGNGDFDFFCPSSSGLPEANGSAEYLCAFFAGSVRCMVILRN
jgi:hypothetical protein